MIRIEWLVLVLAGASIPSKAQEHAPGFPSWAYVMGPGIAAPRVPDDGTRFSVPGSMAQFTRDQTRDRFAPPDWHPEAHPAMPTIVAAGRPPVVWACGFCHRPNGAGGPENARIAGLPAAYIVQQLKDIASGARATVMPHRNAANLKRGMAKALTDEDIQVAADYFSRIAPRPNLVVEESDTAPKTINLLNILAASDDGERVMLSRDRIVEVPENLERFDVLRDDQVKFLVYVPPGSIAKGKALAHAPGGLSGSRPRAIHRRAFAELCRATTLGHAGRGAQWLGRAGHEACRRIAVQPGHAGSRRLSGDAGPVKVAGEKERGTSMQAAIDLIGSWELQRYETWNSEGVVVTPLGEAPVGFAVFDAAGHAFIQLARRPPDVDDPFSDAMAQDLANSFGAYFGTFRLDAAQTRITIRVQASNMASYVGTDQVRPFVITGDQLTLGVPGEYRAVLKRASR